MPETSDVGVLPRTYFKLPRVPFDFRAVALGITGYLTYWVGGLLISRVANADGPNLPGSFLFWFCDQLSGLPEIGGTNGYLARFFGSVFGFGTRPDTASTLEILGGGLWFVAVWAFFGQAIRRVVSLRIARDEGLSFREALTFAAKNWITVLVAPLIIAVAVGIFWVCNWLAGVLLGIPGLGMILSLLLVPLAVISTLLMLLIGFGGVLGFPLVGAAAAWEKNGSLDAISRAFSYVFARPLQYFFNYLLILLFTGIILFAGSWFVAALTRSVEAGVWQDKLAITLNAPERDTAAGSDWMALEAEDRDKVKSYGELTGYTGQAETGGRSGVGSPEQPFVRDFQTVVHGPWYHKVTLFMFWLFVNLVWFGVFGYALFWFLGASSCLYADLRNDVDGTPESEIHTDEDDQPLDAAPPGSSLPPVALPPTAPTPGSAPSAPPPSAEA